MRTCGGDGSPVTNGDHASPEVSHHRSGHPRPRRGDPGGARRYRRTGVAGVLSRPVRSSAEPLRLRRRRAVRVGDTYLIQVDSPEGTFQVSQVAWRNYRVTAIEPVTPTKNDVVVPPNRPAKTKTKNDERAQSKPRAPSTRAGQRVGPRGGLAASDASSSIDVLVVYTTAARLPPVVRTGCWLRSSWGSTRPTPPTPTSASRPRSVWSA